MATIRASELEADAEQGAASGSKRRRRMKRDSTGQPTIVPKTWAKAGVHKDLQDIASIAAACVLFEKGKIDSKDQYRLLYESFHGDSRVVSKSLDVLHGNGRFHFIWHLSSAGPKTLDPYLNRSSDPVLQFESVTAESLSRVTLNNTAILTGEQINLKYRRALRGAVKLEAAYQALGNPSGSNSQSKLQMLFRNVYNAEVDQKNARRAKEAAASAQYSRPEGSLCDSHDTITIFTNPLNNSPTH